MFDPTIFDNWKVVLEGALYDLDRDGEVEVVGRADTIDLAAMSRSFRLSVRRPDGSARAELRLRAGLDDFAGERLGPEASGGDLPGVRLELALTLPGERLRDVGALHDRLRALWPEETDIVHRARIDIDPLLPPASAADAANSAYDIRVRPRRKLGEESLDRIDALTIKLLETLAAVEP